MRRLASCAIASLLLVACKPSARDRERYDAIVARVRPLVTQVEHGYMFRVDDDLDPATLHPFDGMLGRGDGRGLVRAAMDAQQRLAVSIELEDHGHAGESGVMYREAGMPRTALEYVERDSQHETRIDDRWISWSYDMD